MPIDNQAPIHSLPLLISPSYLKAMETKLIQFQRQVALSDAPPPKPINWPLPINELISLYHSIKTWMETNNLSEVHIGQLLPSLENTPIALHKHLVLFWAKYFDHMLQYEENPLNLSSFVSREIDNHIQFAGFVTYLSKKYGIADLTKAGIFANYFTAQSYNLPIIRQTYQLLQELAQYEIHPTLSNIKRLGYFSPNIKGLEKYSLIGESFCYCLYLVPDGTSTEDFITELLRPQTIIMDSYVWDGKNITHLANNKIGASHPLKEINRINTFLNECSKTDQKYVEIPYEDFMHCIHKNSDHAMPQKITLGYEEVSTLTLTLENISNLYQLFGSAIIQSLITMVEPLGESEAVNNTFTPFFEKMSIKELRDCYATSIRHQCVGIRVLGRILPPERSRELFELCQKQPDIVSPWLLLAASSSLQKSPALFTDLKNAIKTLPLTPQCLIGLLSLRSHDQLTEIEESLYAKRIYEYFLQNPAVYIAQNVEFQLDDETQPNLFFEFISIDYCSVAEAICDWLTTEAHVLVESKRKILQLLENLHIKILKSLPLTISTFNELTSDYQQQKDTVKFLFACHAIPGNYPQDNYALFNLIISWFIERDDFDLSSCLDIFYPEEKFAHYPHPVVEQRCAQARVIFEYISKYPLVKQYNAFLCKLNELIFTQPECLGFEIIQNQRIKNILAEHLNKKNPLRLLGLIQMSIERSTHDPRLIETLRNIGILLNDNKLEEIIRLNQISLWKLLDCLGYKDLVTRFGKTKLVKIINLLKKEPISNTNYLHILNVMANTTIFNPSEKKAMSKRIFQSCIEGYVSQEIIDDVIKNLDVSLTWVLCSKSHCYDAFVDEIKQIYPLTQEGLAQIFTQLQIYQHKLQRLAKFSNTIHVPPISAHKKTTSFLILKSHINKPDFNLYQTLDILCGFTNSNRATLLADCMNSTYFEHTPSNYYFKALLQKDENQETALHQLLTNAPECLINILKKAGKARRVVLLKQTNASGESVWAMCLRLYSSTPIFECISEMLSNAQKSSLSAFKWGAQSSKNMGLFNKPKRDRVDSEAEQQPSANKSSRKRQKISMI